jgi:hypothetical protein
MDLGSFRKEWNKDQKRLRNLLQEGSDLEAAKKQFLYQHQILHCADITGSAAWSYADEIFSDLSEEGFREIPRGEEHSLIWILWHISRIEDITMKILVQGAVQEYLSGEWEQRISSPIHHTGNSAPQEDLALVTDQANLVHLLAYRNSVGANTRKLIEDLSWESLRAKVLPERLDRLVDEGAVLKEAEGLLAYWGKRKIHELLLMPPTRHLMVHLNEAWSIKKKLGKDTQSS